ncbi:MAG: beta strand repeat-containing protein, partial [Roseimicrobium sp.]
MFLAATSMVSGQITSSNWTSLAGTWQSAGNWSNGVPTANTRVTIANGGTAVISGIAAQSLSIQVNSSVLTIIAGGTLTTTEVGFTSNPTAIARGTGDTGSVTINGAGSRWQSSTSLTVGDEGTGILNISAGGVFSGTSLSLGDSDTGNGTATVDGVGSRMELAFSFYVGFSGDGTLNILNGAQVTSLSGGLGSAQQLGSDETSSGVVIVDGVGSQWTMTEELNVGGFGSGSLTIRNGGYVSNGFASVGSVSELASSVLVEGAGSQWITTGAMKINGGGPATVTVQNGGFMSIAGGLTMTEFDFEFATVNVNTGGTFAIGGLNGFMAGPGIIAFNLAGGTFRLVGSDLTGNVPITLSGTTSIIDTNGLNATLNGTISGTTFTKTGAGTLILGGANTYNGGTVITGGALQVSADSNLGDASGGVRIENLSTLRFGGSFATSRAIDNYTGATVDTNGFTATLNGVITGAGGYDLTKVGTGDLVLNAVNTYTGTTVVNAGRVFVNGSVSGGAIVQSSATLGGAGTVTGLVTLNDFATLSPGHNGAGTLTVGSLSLSPASVAGFDLGQPGQIAGGNDLVEVTGDFTLDGSVNVNGLAGFQEGAYRLFNYG